MPPDRAACRVVSQAQVDAVSAADAAEKVPAQISGYAGSRLARLAQILIVSAAECRACRSRARNVVARSKRWRHWSRLHRYVDGTKRRQQPGVVVLPGAKAFSPGLPVRLCHARRSGAGRPPRRSSYHTGKPSAWRSADRLSHVADAEPQQVRQAGISCRRGSQMLAESRAHVAPRSVEDAAERADVKMRRRFAGSMPAAASSSSGSPSFG